MNKHDNMLLANKRLSEEKKILAINTIRRMVKNDEHISIVELVKFTGLSRSFFYKNAQVKAELDQALVPELVEHLTEHQTSSFQVTGLFLSQEMIFSAWCSSLGSSIIICP